MKKVAIKFGKSPGFPCRIRIKPAPKSRKRRRKLSRQRRRKLQVLSFVMIVPEPPACPVLQMMEFIEKRMFEEIFRSMGLPPENLDGNKD